MALTKKERNRKYQQSHKPQLAKKMRIYRGKKKLADAVRNALFDYEVGIGSIRWENWRIKNG